MPELPEVETLRRELEPKLKHRTIEQVRIWEPKTIQPLSPKQFGSKIRGRRIIDLKRQAKVLVITLEPSGYLITHLKMTGQLIWHPKTGRPVFGGHPQPGGLSDLPNKFTRLALHLDNDSTLYFNDMRKFGWMRYSQDPNQEEFLNNIGVEPLTKEFNPEVLEQFLKHYPKRNIKQLLLDQELIAGLGNIYVDEALFQAKIRPDRSVEKITDQETEPLHKAIQSVLRLSIKKKGTSFRDYKRSNGEPGGFMPYLKVYGRAGEPCFNCNRTIEKTVVAGRGTHYCVKCQR